MVGRPDEIRGPLDRIASLLAGRWSEDGWSRQWFDDLPLVAFMKPTGDGTVLSVEVQRLRNGTWDDVPVVLGVTVGVGWQPALDLRPLLTLDPRLRTVGDRDGDRDHRLLLEFPTLAELGDVVTTVERIVQHVAAQVPVVRDAHPDAASIEAGLRDATKAEDASSSVQDLLVHLAAMGKGDEARALLASYASRRQDDEPDDRDDRRFVRQLTRWLDAGCPPPPPLEQTLALLPRQPPRPRWSWSEDRAERKAEEGARRAVRSQATGRTIPELRVLIAEEHRSRGIDIAPSMVEITIEMLRLHQRHLGGVRQTLRAGQLIAETVRTTVANLRAPRVQTPDWLRLPVRASYPMVAHPTAYRQVRTAMDAHAFLERVRAEAPQRVGPFVEVEAWLSTDSSGLVVHIGDRRVGTIATDEAPGFAAALRAAALFDEEPYTAGRVYDVADGGPPRLEIPLAQPAPDPNA